MSPRHFFFAGFIALLALALAGWWFFNRTPQDRSGTVPAANQPQLRRLTNQGRVNRAVISPDGKFFAYTLVEKGSYRTEIRLGQTDGSSDVVLRPFADVFHHPISFSADGSSLYFVISQPVSSSKVSRGAFFKMPLPGGVPQKLADDVNIFSVLSPDEKQIAFRRNNPENKTAAIVIADADGSNEREIATRSISQMLDTDRLSWSADGQFIAFDAVTGDSKTDTSNKSYEVFVVRTSDGVVSQLTTLGWNRISVLEWLKDGGGLVAAARNSEQMNTSSLWLIDYPDGQVRRISRDVNRYGGSLSLSADSSSLLVVQFEIETNLWLAPAEKLSAARQITYSTSGRQDGWSGMDWTSDGRIVYTAWIDESLTIWSMEADGSNAKQLTSIGFRDEKPSVTTDGKFIVFQSNRSGATEIWRMDIDGGNLQQLTKDGGNSDASVTADGIWVVYRHAAEDDSSLWRVPLNGGEPLLMTDKKVLVPQISPDGKYVACGLPGDGETKLAIFSITGGEPLKLFDLPQTYNFRFGSGIRWSPDGRSISYPDESNGIWRQDLSGGSATRLEGIPAERTFSFGWSPDGNQFAFGRVREVRDAVLITDFR